MGQSFMPDFGETSVVKGRPWLYTPILPLVFGAELSYMEQVAKLHMKVNELIQNDTIVGENFAELVEAFKQWEEYLNGLSVADGAITTAKLADGAVTAPKIAQQAVESQHIAKGAVGSQELGEQAVEGHNLAVGAVDRFSKIANGVIVSEHFAPGAVDTSAIAQRAVESQHIAKGAVGSQELGEQAVEGHNLAVGAVDRFSKIADGVIILAHFSNEVIEAFGNKLPMPDNAQVGQYIRVSAVDADGKVTATEGVYLDAAPGVATTIISDTPTNTASTVMGFGFTSELKEEEV